ncbi:formylglycine-generating enzyme family protein [Aurantiacibacter poecillastricola]|uniref:formylglycine-generating enzyme family protein n=1 Tax=Aurantiacibacter poecillastricola TaxID=3064385 RepID=UPI00273EF924|nr:formylglycine-generating enzyme family protein [Aurantiacibacter sp. 219JJ12-13]MDP5262929.1 formylglycine-generating enzyme family protein [Aurantiacibacter sp. 219JJ12-13]
MRARNTTCLSLLALTLALAACEGESEAPARSAAIARSCAQIGDEPIRLEGGTFAMGQDDIYAEEGPVRETTVDGFWIDPHEVTNRQFAEFVESTGHVTVAEKPVDPAAFGVPEEQIPAELLLPGSAVFTPPERPSNSYADWWKYVPGASWKKPYGPNGPEAQSSEPVVHLAWDDMQAYAEWKGGRLPTEAEWEYAASAGQPASTEQPEEANSWQGVFPAINQETDGFKGIAPVGCYEPNPNGLYDMVGNVWEVTADLFRPGHDPADTDNPRGPSENGAYDPLNPGFPSRVMKGGSYLCAPNYCQRYRPASRQGRDPGLGASNVGFRLAYDAPPA